VESGSIKADRNGERSASGAISFAAQGCRAIAFSWCIRRFSTELSTRLYAGRQCLVEPIDPGRGFSYAMHERPEKYLIWQPRSSMQTDHANPAALDPPGIVVTYPCKPSINPRSHERIGQQALARKLAALIRFDYGGDFNSACAYAAPLYIVPSDTLPSLDLARQLGIFDEQDLFGGVVPYPFVATKIITHPLVKDDAQAIAGWSADFAQCVEEVVLPGFSAFAPADARTAALQLLEQGSVRMKKASGVGGRGQLVIPHAAALDDALQSVDLPEWSHDGVVFESNLNQVATHSVGQVRVKQLLVTYCGLQQLTTNHHGEEVYGGSHLTVVRGDFDALLALGLDDATQTAVAQARAYHAAAFACFPGMLASRSNYDVAQGLDDRGRWRSGVLEQSWRIGGASGAEIAALEAFASDPQLKVVCASTTELYQANPVLPPDAVIYCQQVDERVGPITKYVRTEPYVYPR
jgi:hypothetical protein